MSDPQNWDVFHRAICSRLTVTETLVLINNAAMAHYPPSPNRLYMVHGLFLVRDIAVLTQHLNQLENGLNWFSEENEVLRGRLGLGEGENVDVSVVRGKREARLHQLLRDNRMLEKEVGVFLM